MQEQILTKVSFEERLKDILYSCIPFDSQHDLRTYMAQIVEHAYTAGFNRYVAGTQPSQGLNDTGEVVVLATNYAKFKGFRK